MNDSDKMTPQDYAAGVFEASFEVAELACRIAEAITQSRRPDGMTGAEALAGLSDETRTDMLRAADRAMEYFRERVTASVRHARH
jgi:hypothetical protein